MIAQSLTRTMLVKLGLSDHLVYMYCRACTTDFDSLLKIGKIGRVTLLIYSIRLLSGKIVSL